MDLHIGYETCPEHPGVICEVDGLPDEGAHADPEVYRVGGALRRGRSAENRRMADRSVLVVNDRVQLVGIPARAHDYMVSGRSPLEWAVSSLARNTDKKSGIVADPNGWHAWVGDPFDLIRHVRRLVHVSVRSAEIVDGLPPALADGQARRWPRSDPFSMRRWRCSEPTAQGAWSGAAGSSV